MAAKKKSTKRRWKFANYKPNAHRNAKESYADHMYYAKWYAKEARADDAFNAKRKREGKKSVPSVTKSARENRRRAARHLAAAKKYRGVSSRSRDAKKPYGRRGSSWSWELWSHGDGRASDRIFVAAYKDKAAAQRREKVLRKSHPYARYFLKRTKGEPRSTIGGHRRKRAVRRFHR